MFFLELNCGGELGWVVLGSFKTRKAAEKKRAWHDPSLAYVGLRVREG